jgi:hypothetical protein
VHQVTKAHLVNNNWKLTLLVVVFVPTDNIMSDHGEMTASDASASNNIPPSVAVRWMIRNTPSNVELAILSNVCRRWREIASKTIVEEVLGIGGEEADPHHNDDGSGNRARKKKANDVARTLSPLSSLLLPSSASFLARYSKHQQKSASHSIVAKFDEDNHRETYCVAWFHPDGIEFKQVPLDPMDETEINDGNEGNDPGRPAGGVYAGDHRVTSGEEPFAPGGEFSYAGSDNGGHEGRNGQQQSRRNHSRSRSPAPTMSSSNRVSANPGVAPRQLRQNLVPASSSSQHQQQLQQQSRDWVSCLYQWNGYSEMMDVLRPFGYASSFVRVSPVAYFSDFRDVLAGTESTSHPSCYPVACSGCWKKSSHTPVH